MFVEGKYDGSALAVVERDDVFEVVRELPVVGGTGGFWRDRVVRADNYNNEPIENP